MTTLTYNASPTMQAFHADPSFVRGIMGPIGSGKSVACVWEIFMCACRQKPNQDGVRKSKWAVVRNTLPELETTTMKTWTDWFPPGETRNGGWGKMTRKPPYTHQLEYYPGDGTKVELEVLFLALDKDTDVKKLLSLEVSGIWFNEARELRKSLIDAGTGRIGRYPSVKDGGCTDPRLIMDTNPPDDSHWWFKCAEENGWAVDEKGKPIDPQDVPAKDRWKFFQQPSGLSDDAENLENLNQPPNFASLPLHVRRDLGRGYYRRIVQGKDQEWIRVYVDGQYGNIKAGLPVYGDMFKSELHIAEHPLRPLPPGASIYVGIDCSGRHPASVFAQKTSRGQIQVLSELCVLDDTGMGATRYSQLLAEYIAENFPEHDIFYWGDPAGGFKTQNDEHTYFDILRANGIRVRSANEALRIPDRIETVKHILGELIDGEPRLLVSPSCKHLIRGFEGGYRYRKMSVSGDDRYDDKPEKNRFSDVQDGLQYLLCGMGVTREMKGRSSNRDYQTYSSGDWSIW